MTACAMGELVHVSRPSVLECSPHPATCLAGELKPATSGVTGRRANFVHSEPDGTRYIESLKVRMLMLLRSHIGYSNVASDHPISADESRKRECQSASNA